MIFNHIGWWWILLCSEAIGTTVNKLNTWLYLFLLFYCSEDDMIPYQASTVCDIKSFNLLFRFKFKFHFQPNLATSLWHPFLLIKSGSHSEELGWWRALMVECVNVFDHIVEKGLHIPPFKFSTEFFLFTYLMNTKISCKIRLCVKMFVLSPSLREMFVPRGTNKSVTHGGHALCIDILF